MQKKKKVALFINDLNSLGGIQRVVGNLAAGLTGVYDVVVLTSEPLPMVPAFHAPGVSYFSLNFHREGSGRVSLLIGLMRLGSRVRSFCKQYEIDVVMPIWSDLSVVCALSLIGTGVVSIGCEHTEYGGATRMWRLLRRVSYRFLSAVVCLTEADVGKYRRLNPRSFVVPNFVPNIENTFDQPRKKHLLTVGHLVPRKGLDRLLWDLAAPLREHPDWTLIVVGGGELSYVDWNYFAYVSAIIRGLGLESRVKIYPATPEIDAFYDDASIYVMGSRSEGLPMVLLEAKWAGLPIVAYDCPTGPREIIRHDQDGFLVQERSGQFSMFVERLIMDEGLRTAMGKNGRADVEQRFTEHVVIRMWIVLIDALLSGQPAAAIERGLSEKVAEASDPIKFVAQ